MVSHRASAYYERRAGNTVSISYMDYTSPSTQFSFDVNTSLFFKKNNQNYINVLSINQLNTLGNTSMLDIYLSAGNVVEPHIHQNASELVYCVTGAAVVSIVNPFTKKLMNFPIKPGQVANVPQGWWHYEIAMEDDTHLIAIFDAPIPEFIGGSDLLRLTPPEVFAQAYCLDAAKVKETFAPITDTVFIGPPNSCKTNTRAEQEGEDGEDVEEALKELTLQLQAAKEQAQQLKAMQEQAMQEHTSQLKAWQEQAVQEQEAQLQAMQDQSWQERPGQEQAVLEWTASPRPDYFDTRGKSPVPPSRRRPMIGNGGAYL